ncbi:CBS domain-containing protein [Halovenus sp. WSH3]|uniref:CBS domain-containing protein n=1 Tax=Halovenus carboxidivorans TaxID=2692199 RepID=A0A6B0T9X0_9EURY|nr:CBS domain-containing protein [Halovenus carboxidivorans]MXR52041.1 CBS domain-containing protein [Halovenus carboxidivorans]
MIDVPVSSAMVEREPLIGPTETTASAAARLRDPEIPALFVVESQTLIGVVTESDIVATVAEGGENPPVEAYMSTPVQTADPTLPVGLAADRMRDAGISVLPIVDNGYEGFVTADHLAPYLPRHRLDIRWDGDPIRLSES